MELADRINNLEVKLKLANKAFQRICDKLGVANRRASRRHVRLHKQVAENTKLWSENNELKNILSCVIECFNPDDLENRIENRILTLINTNDKINLYKAKLLKQFIKQAGI